MKNWAMANHLPLGRFGSCDHRQGLPTVPDSIEVKPSYAPDGNASLLLVTPNTVQRFCISMPYAYSHWYPTSEEQEYEDRNELEAILKSMIDPPATAWED
jgi:hypothetical protein